MTVPSLGGASHEEIRIGLSADGSRYLRVQAGPVPSPTWKRLVDAASDGDEVKYGDHAAEFIAAGVTGIGDQDTEPVPLDPGDADTIANTYPVHVVNKMLLHVIAVNTVGWPNPKD